MTPTPNDVNSQFAATVGESFAAVLSQITARQWTATEAPNGALDAELRTSFAIDGAPDGISTLALTTKAAKQLAAFLTGEPANNADALSSDESEAAIELCRQVMGQVATALRPTHGEVRFQQVPSTTSASRNSSVRLTLRDSTDESVDVGLETSPDLARALEARLKVGTKTAPENSSTEPMQSAVTPQAHPGTNLDLLLDVEIGVTLRFGKREMLMKDILELSTGSVIELDRMVQEPVDLLIDRKVIARGEVVIVDGNYGLRVTEVAAPQQKIECLPYRTA